MKTIKLALLAATTLSGLVTRASAAGLDDVINNLEQPAAGENYKLNSFVHVEKDGKQVNMHVGECHIPHGKSLTYRTWWGIPTWQKSGRIGECSFTGQIDDPRSTDHIDQEYQCIEPGLLQFGDLKEKDVDWWFTQLTNRCSAIGGTSVNLPPPFFGN